MPRGPERIAAGDNLAPHFEKTHKGVVEWNLNQPLMSVRRGTITVSVNDRQGNTARVERTFSVGGEAEGK